MKVAVVHYHLRPGGVTRVIGTALAATRAQGIDTCVLSGEAPPDAADFPIRVVPTLAYRDQATPADAHQLARDLAAAARDTLGGPPDLWHIHNHSLGKNVALPEALHLLLRDGAHLLLQIHDFAEDGRPANYNAQRAYFAGRTRDFEACLYPSGPHIHYGVLNARDAAFLTQAGIPQARLHALANPVVAAPPDPSAPPPPVPDHDRVLLYPTRGIRRKNMGELALLSCLAGPGTHFVSTLGPANPEWQPIHDRWEQVVARHHLPVLLAAVDKAQGSFAAWINRADALLTTSVAEGFGLAFLEPWLLGKAIVGRDLPEITRDFRGQGLALDHLYRRLEVPLAWINEDRLRDDLRAGLQATYRAYGLQPPPDAPARAFRSIVEGERVDFGRLNEPLQELVIRHCLETPPTLRGHVQDHLQPPGPDLIARNRHLVASRYAPSAYGQHLADIYRSLTSSPRADLTCLDGHALLDAFLRPERFSLLRS